MRRQRSEASLSTAVEEASGLVHAMARPSLVQLVLRVALAVPFWRSGILKWYGFLQLSDTAVTLFTDEFMLHLPGGPYDFPAPAVMAFLSGSVEICFRFFWSSAWPRVLPQLGSCS